jgi:hypothetical protein
VGVLGLVSFMNGWQILFDPCQHWATEGQSQGLNLGRRRGNISASLPPPSGGFDPCAQRVSFTAETRHQAMRRLVIFPGGLLIGSVLGILGTLYAFPLLIVLGAAILLAESPFIMTMAPLTFAGGVLLLLAARKARLQKRTVPPPDRVH